MHSRRLAAVLALLALIATLASPCASLASSAVAASNGPIANCHLLAAASPLAPGQSDQAPPDDMDREACSCALCELGWTTLPPADDLFAIRSLEYRFSPRAPPAQALVTIRLNRSAPARGPPAFA
ncbi:MAG: hypothetical protein AB7F41_07435 [Methylocystis sp.]|uniref:hypothetical protein n=1 Tax=Methylocystis sp. TaxID=1911079 RepID=UPI003D0A5D05